MSFKTRRLSRGAAYVCAVLLVMLLGPIAAQTRNGISQDREFTFPTLAPVVRAALRAAVVVHNAKRLPVDRRLVDPANGFPDPPLPGELESHGAGVIVDADRGLVVTSNHVIADADKITLTLDDGRLLYAGVLASSEHDDLAVLRIAPASLTAIKMAEPDKIEVGDFVLAIGDRMGLGPSTTIGIVSGLHRSCRPVKNTDLIQTDALIDKGDSGGVLINVQGELVGIIVARIDHGNGIGFGFAVPVAAVRSLLISLRLD